MTTFRKRVFTPQELLKRLGLVTVYSPFLLRGLIHPATSPALREKIMLAVTSVNDCRYCAWVHTHLALKNGIDIDEINTILQHSKVQAGTSADAAAILFAQHYADTNGAIEPSALAALQHHFSTAQIREIKSYIHVIYIGNLSGNTFDALLARQKGVEVEGSSALFEVLCALITAPVLLLIMIKARLDRKVELAAL